MHPNAGVRLPTHKHIMHTYPAPSVAPGELTVSYRLPTTAELSWSHLQKNKQNGVIIKYTVKVIRDDLPSDMPVELDAATNFIKIIDLRPFTSYTFKVSAVTKAGSGPAATILSTTPEAGKWHIIQILTKVFIRWIYYHTLAKEGPWEVHLTWDQDWGVGRY